MAAISRLPISSKSGIFLSTSTAAASSGSRAKSSLNRLAHSGLGAARESLSGALFERERIGKGIADAETYPWRVPGQAASYRRPTGARVKPRRGGLVRL